MPLERSKAKRITLFVDRLTQGGVQHSYLGLAKAFVDRGVHVDLVIGDRRHSHDYAMPDRVGVHFLHGGRRVDHVINDLRIHLQKVAKDDRSAIRTLPRRWRSYVPGLAAYLAARRPDAMLSAKSLGNLVAIFANRRAGVDTRLVISERGHFSEGARLSRKVWRSTTLPRLMKTYYPFADDVVAISRSVGDDLAVVSGLDRRRITTIHNALLRPDAIAMPPSDHPWFQDEIPVILAAGRLDKEKDFPTLLHAFAKLCARRPVRLMIIGEGKDREKLKGLIQSLGLSENVLLPGFQENPFSFMKAADLFVLSSTHEGFGNVLIEALASGCPIVSTACPGGPVEILDGGRFGHLVPVSDPDAMADGMEAALDRPTPPEQLCNRAADFSMDRTADQYLACLLPDAPNRKAEAA